MIRPAKFADIVALIGLWKAAHGRSEKYKAFTFDEGRAKNLLRASIMNHGNPNAGGTWCMVAEKGWLQGFLFAMLDHIGDVGVELFATDFKFIVDPAADARAALLLRDSMIAWGKANPRVAEFVVGVHDAVGDYRRTAKMWEQKGFTEIGLMLGHRIEREAARSVA